jgi:hypothetical protein
MLQVLSYFFSFRARRLEQVEKENKELLERLETQNSELLATRQVRPQSTYFSLEMKQG